MTYKNTSKKTYNIKNKFGGKVIASGGFGCVFKPALACANGTRKPNGVSKLMTLKHANDEYDEITKIKNKLNKIPNYSKYFLIDNIDNLCVPAKLKSRDLRNFKLKCSALKKNYYTAKNINRSLNELRVLSMPDGGITLKEYMYNITNLKQVQILNTSLIELFTNGIIPMNEKGIYHSDIKDSNILVDTTNDNVHPRLIDWGLTTEYPLTSTSAKYTFSWPAQWNNKSLQFNVPFSVILFSADFLDQYNDYVREYGMPDEDDATNIAELDLFIVEYLYFWMESGRGVGHISTINAIVEILYDLNKTTNETDKITKQTDDINKGPQNEYVVVYVKTIEIITIYIRKILIKYTKQGQFNTISIDDYLNNVFIKNIDKWGFVSTYLPFLKMASKASKDNLDKNNNENIFNIFKDLFIFLYETSDRAITQQEVTSRLNAINQLVGGTRIKQHNKTIGKNTYKTRIQLSNYKKPRKTRKIRKI
jgi:serine/threonine protein kinase